MARSLINAFPGLPPDEPGAIRLCILTSWTRAGIVDACAKANSLNERRWTASGAARAAVNPNDACRTLGELGIDGDEWFYIPVYLHDSDLDHTISATSDRYGFHRWVWTEDTEAEATSGGAAQEGKADG